MTAKIGAQMKTIGVLGGMSNQATAEYYRGLNAGVNARRGGWNTAEVIINSVNFARIEEFVRADQWDESGVYLSDKARGLERAGADFFLCVSNTMHRVAPAFTAAVTIPFLHIADPTAQAIRAAGLQRVALLGTLPVMAADYMKRRYLEFGVETLVPTPDEQAEIDRMIFDELVKGVVSPVSAHCFSKIVGRLASKGAEGVVLGCTEFFMLLALEDFGGLPVFNTTALHIEQAVALALEEGP